MMATPYEKLRQKYEEHFRIPAQHAMPDEEDLMSELIQEALDTDTRLPEVDEDDVT
jgi:hypothetical protein